VPEGKSARLRMEAQWAEREGDKKGAEPCSACIYAHKGMPGGQDFTSYTNLFHKACPKARVRDSERGREQLRN